MILLLNWLVISGPWVLLDDILGTLREIHCLYFLKHLNLAFYVAWAVTLIGVLKFISPRCHSF